MIIDNSLSLDPNRCLTSTIFSRRIHISQSTYNNLKGEFEVEPGFGSERDEFLKDHKIKTFLIVDKSHQTKDYESSNSNGSKSDGMVSVNEPTVILRPSNLQKRRQSPVQFITSRWADKLPRLSLTKCMQDEYWKPEIPFSNVRKDFFLRINIIWHQVN